jgi:uncharacterized protein
VMVSHRDRWRAGSLAAGLLLAASPAPARQNALPADVQKVIVGRFDADTRYLDGAADLNGDGKPELVVHVVGPMACGSGGCPTMVFTPAAAGYRLVSTISVSNPPVRVSATSTAGWRNLIVRVRGGGAKAGDVELISDGKGYPANPTVPGPRVKPAAGTGADVLIPELKSFDDAKPLSKGGAPAQGARGSGPSFDCGKVTTAVEKLVCSDAALAGLDRSLSGSYAKALGNMSEAGKAAQRQAEASWIARRNACAKAGDVRDCVETSYKQRLTEVQIIGGELLAPAPVAFTCKGRQDPLTVAFYKQTDPPSAVITMGDRQAIAFIARSGSGSRYTSAEVDYWEHQGEATVKWGGVSLACKPNR